MAVTSISHPTTIAQTFSFYVSSSELRALQVRSELPDVVTVNAPNGPASVSSTVLLWGQRPLLAIHDSNHAVGD
jgi:hypothetical protein